MSTVDTPEPSEKKGRSYRLRGSRFKARRRAVDILYEAELRDVDPVAIVQDRIGLAENDANQVAPVAPYSQQIITGVAEELDQIDEVISTYLSVDWELHRISAVDRAILRVAVWELIFNEDVPLKTALSEAVELAARYSGAKAPAYINAVLDSAVKDIDELRNPSVVEQELSFEEALSEAEKQLDNSDDNDVPHDADDTDTDNVPEDSALVVAEEQLEESVEKQEPVNKAD